MNKTLLTKIRRIRTFTKYTSIAQDEPVFSEWEFLLTLEMLTPAGESHVSAQVLIWEKYILEMEKP